jgi:hypothetical protein
MKRKLLFPVIAALLLAPWPVAYAYDEAMAVNAPMTIEAAEPGATPSLQAYRNFIGSITPGDLFYIDVSETATDTFYTLCITNTDELIRNYRYMNLNIGVYVQTDIDKWEKVGVNPPDIYLTMQNGAVDIKLPGCGNYKITVDKGCFYCHGVGAEGNVASPEFYLSTS